MEGRRSAMKGTIMKIGAFDLGQTLDCGQCFRWERREDGAYQGIASGRFLTMDVSGIEKVCEDPFWAQYFDAAVDYDKIREELSQKDEILAQAAAFAPGIRILNQDPWEALCSFIISQNNNIPRIKGIVSRLCALLGDPCGGGWAFPGPERMARCTPEDLAPLRAGFRAKYLVDAAQKVAAGRVDLEELRTQELGKARESLTRILGVGNKVADCTLLYGLHRLDAFPMDVWMKRAMKILFPGREPAWFGEYAGIAQQYIFHYSRCHAAIFEK